MAFSGTVTDPDASGVEYTESGMNVDAKGKYIKEKELPERFRLGGVPGAARGGEVSDRV